MAWNGLTITTPDDVTHALEECAVDANTVWISCMPWRSVHVSVAMIWGGGKLRAGKNIDCMTCLVTVARRAR